MRFCFEGNNLTIQLGKGEEMNTYAASLRTSLIMAFLFLGSTWVLADTILDNGQAGTSSAGTWQVSGASGFYGTDSVWARNGATYTWALPANEPGGDYEIFMWWSPWASRGTNIAVDVNTGLSTTRIYVNQALNGSSWNSLGVYTLSPGAAVTIIAASGSTVSTCADAVMFKAVTDNNAPSASIDSIIPNPAPLGEQIVFAGHGTDSDGNVIGHEWSSDLDGVLSDANSFSKSNLREGNHTISYKVKDDKDAWSEPITMSLQIAAQSVEMIVDNGEAGTTSTGTWQVSGGTTPYGGNSLWARNGATYTWYMNAPQSGTYEVFMWWSGLNTRSSNVAVDVASESGTSRVYVDQSRNSGVWNSLGKFSLLSTKSYAVKVTASSGSTVSTCADAIRFVKATEDPSPGTEKIYACEIYSWDKLFLTQMGNMLKRIGAQSDSTGEKWAYTNSSLRKSYAIQFVRSKEAFLAALKESGSHVIVGGHSNFGVGAACVTSAEMGSSKVTSIRYADDPKFLLFGSNNVSVKTEGMKYGQAYPNWKPIFQDGTSAMAPYTHEEGVPAYNYMVSYRPPGETRFSRVQLEISKEYVARLNDTKCSAWFSATGALPDPQINPEYFVVYPFDEWSRCRYVGTWVQRTPTSSYQGEGGNFGYNYATHAAGTGSNKAIFDCLVFMPGEYKVQASWVTQSTNATNTKYLIRHANGSSTVTVDQTSGAAEWNTLGTYKFNRGVSSIEVSDNANGTVIADAVILTPTSNPEGQLQAEFSVNRMSGNAPLSVTFTNTSTAYNNTKTYLWDFGDGETSTATSPTHIYSSEGVYTVSLRVTDARGNSDTETKLGMISVGTSSSSIRAEFTVKTRRQTSGGRLVVQFTNTTTGNATDWLWDFGDGTTSTLKNPKKVFYAPGYYTVSLRATGPNGGDTSTERDYIQILAVPVYVDNAFEYKPHYITSGSRPSNKNILNLKNYRVNPSELRYSRLFYGTCNSSTYFLETFQRGIVFCTTTDIEDYLSVQYLEQYMKGKSDPELVEYLNTLVPSPAFDYVNFDLKPPSER
ncbi:MAG: hypothetical protein A2Y07_05125 [Planctomycetes bacterium GWF2_50_10]|nr:MAG: hypothetical protein A2Y07_05125 [Planctomycetes bacterium GWF2_50_10]